MSSAAPRIIRFASIPNVAAALLCVAASAAFGQAEDGKRLPALGGHNFIISAEVPDPFITTFFRNATGGGVAFDIQSLVVDDAGDTLVSASGDLAFLELGFEFQAALADWVALHVGFDGGARVGTSLEALLGTGVSAVYGYFLGGTFRLLQTNRVFLSATADFTGNTIYDIGVLGLITQAIEEGDVPDSAALVDKGTDKAAEGGLRFAWAASRLVGVRVNGRIGIADLFREDVESKLSYFAGAAVGLNFANTSSVPIGLLGFLKLANFNPGSTDIVGSSAMAGLEIDYTGVEDFGLGLTLAWRRFETTLTSQAIDSFDAIINLRYFF